MVVLLPTDPLIHERPLVGVWVANLTRQWDSEAQRHPLLWSTLLRYALRSALPTFPPKLENAMLRLTDRHSHTSPTPCLLVCLPLTARTSASA